MTQTVEELEKELDVARRAKDALDIVAGIMGEAAALGLSISWGNVGPSGKKGRYEVGNFKVLKDLTFDLK